MSELDTRSARNQTTARDRVVFAALLVAIVAFYAPLYHSTWVLGGDGDVFLSVARSLALGEGYRFNGQPVAIIPPGWPLVLAGMLRVTTRFALLVLVPAGCLIGFLGISYWVLRRFTTPLGAAACVFVAGMLYPTFSLAFLFYSDPLFALLAMTALWQAMRVNEGADSGWRVGVLALVCAASVMVRWTGVIWVAIVAAALISGESLPRVNRRWIAALICLLITLATFAILRAALRVDPARIDPRYDVFVAEHYDLLNIEPTAQDQLSRLLLAGRWIGSLFWFVGVDIRWSRALTNIAGWAAIGLMIIALVESTRRKNWIALAVCVYVAILIANWPGAIPRYLLPAAPLLLVGAFNGILRPGELLPAGWRELRWIGVHYFFGSIVLANLLLYSIEVRAVRDPDPMSRLYAGYHKELLDSASWVAQQPSGGSEIAISSRLVNFGTPYFTDGFRRALNLLTARAIITVPQPLCREPDDELIVWADRNRVRYYLYQPPIELINHFHRTGWHGLPRDPDATAWRLYEIRDGQAHRIRPDPVHGWPTRVPGM